MPPPNTTRAPCPKTPQADNPEALGFERQGMSDWLRPRLLLQAAIKAVLASIFGAYADKREIQAALSAPREYCDYSTEKEIWIDYIADLGDGFDATYTMAKLLAAEQLTLRHSGTEHVTPRGRILVFGGDQVYPTAGRDEYRNRLKMPYKAALPCVVRGESPHLFAIPGNHDWYDGLTNFIRIFCQERWFGGWKTRQHRSYFALKLPQHWWLWGIDVQLESYVDKPQLDFFDTIATQHLERGDRVILCTAQPTWVYSQTLGPQAFSSHSFFEDRIIRERGGGRPTLSLAGDLHHYCRYESADRGVQRITSGGGGAYLYATHQMPKELQLAEGSARVEYARKETFPSQSASRRLAFGCLRLPWRNWRFGILLASLYALYAWFVQSASKALASKALAGASFMERLQELTFTSDHFVLALRWLIIALAHSPASVLLTLLIIGGLYAFCDARHPLVKLATGSAHSLLHILLNVLLIWAFARLNGHVLGWPIDSVKQVVAFAVEMTFAGGLFGGFLFATYLLLCSFVGKFHTNEVFAGQRIPDYKNFLRLHIDATGKLTIFPVAVPKVCTKWRLAREAKDGQSWFEPDPGPIAASLIEDPIEVKSRG